MISSVYVENFKTFAKADFSLENLTIMTGQNGLGKSSFIQILLLLRQSYEKGTLRNKGLYLNGEYVWLGMGKDIYATDGETDEILFEIEWNRRQSAHYMFHYKADSDLQTLEKEKKSKDFDPYGESLFTSSFQYLSANRIEPRLSYKMSDYHINQLHTLGIHGEYTPHYLFHNQNNNIPLENLAVPEAKDCSIGTQINAWMGKISPGIHVTASSLDMNSVRLGYKYETAQGFTNEFKPANTGFGVTYVLPVVTAILTARKGDLVMIENPEAHLHPSGQSVIGLLCALAAQNGVQLIIETHSDHILNGIRVAVKRKSIEPSAIAVYFFERDSNLPEHKTEIIRPVIDEYGRISSMPAGFMDEYGKNLDELLTE